MKVLIAVATVFFVAIGAAAAYLAYAGAGHEYDLKYVVQIDARSMPAASKGTPPLAVQGEGPPSRDIPEVKVDAASTSELAAKPRFRFDDRSRPATELRAQE